MVTSSDAQRAEWLALLEAERDRRAAKVKLEAAAAERQHEKLIEQIITMGERLLGGGEPVYAILEELLATGGDRAQIDVI